MGICISAEIQEQRAKNRSIERETEVSKNEATIKLLLLGVAGSGKSTILKQMIILQADGFSEQEIEHKKLVVRENTIDSMTSLLKAMDNLNISLDNIELEPKAKDVLAITRGHIIEDSQASNSITFGSVKIALSQLWADEGVQKCYERRNEFQLEDCTKYILDNSDRIWSPTYKPTNQDILHSRTVTAGVRNGLSSGGVQEWDKWK